MVILRRLKAKGDIRPGKVDGGDLKIAYII
jgi:hypothetical protein